MAKKELTFPITKPLWYQEPSWYAVDAGKRFKIISYPRRHGKDFEDLSLVCRAALMRKGSYYYVFPTRKWAKRAIWDTIVDLGGNSKKLVDHIFPKEIVKRKNETDLFLELINGSMFFMGGTDNLDFVGQGGQGYVMSEFSLHKEEATGLIMPIVRQSNGFLYLNGTMRSKNNPLYKIMKKVEDNAAWYSSWLRPEQTKLYCWVGGGIEINPELLPYIGRTDPATGQLYANAQGVPFWNVQDDIDSGAISQSLAKQEFLNDAISLSAGAYYAYEMDSITRSGRFKSIDPYSQPVYTFWDLGGAKESSDKTAIVFAHVNEKKITIVDYHEDRGHLREHYFNVLTEKKYNYAGHFMPHDAKKTDAYTGESVVETARVQFGLDARAIPKTSSVSNDIEIVRRSMASMEINSDLCEDLKGYLETYHENPVTEKPCHSYSCNSCNGASDGADAVRQAVMAVHLNIVRPYLIPIKHVPRADWWNEVDTNQEYLIDDDFLA